MYFICNFFGSIDRFEHELFCEGCWVSLGILDLWILLTQAKKIKSWAGFLGLFSSNWAQGRFSAYVGLFFIHILKNWAKGPKDSSQVGPFGLISAFSTKFGLFRPKLAFRLKFGFFSSSWAFLGPNWAFLAQIKSLDSLYCFTQNP